MITKLREYPIFHLFHVPGTNMIVADALSRIANFHVKTPGIIVKVTTPFSIIFCRDSLQSGHGLGKNMNEQIEKELQIIDRINVAEKKKIVI